MFRDGWMQPVGGSSTFCHLLSTLQLEVHLRKIFASPVATKKLFFDVTYRRVRVVMSDPLPIDFRKAPQGQNAWMYLRNMEKKQPHKRKQSEKHVVKELPCSVEDTALHVYLQQSQLLHYDVFNSCLVSCNNAAYTHGCTATKICPLTLGSSIASR